jgi:hypothetical protein
MANWRASRVESVYPEWQAHAASVEKLSPAPEQVTPVVTEVGGEEALLVSRGTKLLSGQGPIQQILSSKSRLPPIV